jgi:hypothetical protein
MSNVGGESAQGGGTSTVIRLLLFKLLFDASVWAAAPSLNQRRAANTGENDVATAAKHTTGSWLASTRVVESAAIGAEVRSKLFVHCAGLDKAAERVGLACFGIDQEELSTERNMVTLNGVIE